MKIIVGLGNPGKKYEKTRHNLGFMVVDELMQKSKFKINEKFSAEICEPENNILLVKPQTFMNGSGQAVAKIARFYKVEPKNIWVIHDDVDISMGKLKIRIGGSGAGHHGVESIIESLGMDKFLRFRLGIGKPHQKESGSVEEYVLQPFEVHKKTELKHLIKRTIQAVEVALKDGPAKAMNRFNR